jgi:branched-chain amino acid transport system substrate-binding protein
MIHEMQIARALHVRRGDGRTRLTQSFGPEDVMLTMLDKVSRLTIAAGGMIAVGFAAPAMAQNTIKIGAPLALTGGLADEGHKQVVVWDMWLERVNAAGGINVGGKKMKAEIVKYDYQTNGTRAGQLAEKLATDDKVDFMLAPFGSGHTKIVAAVTERYGIPMLACAASSESVFDQSCRARA